jgi:hypothetical protein
LLPVKFKLATDFPQVIVGVGVDIGPEIRGVVELPIGVPQATSSVTSRNAAKSIMTPYNKTEKSEV